MGIYETMKTTSVYYVETTLVLLYDCVIKGKLPFVEKIFTFKHDHQRNIYTRSLAPLLPQIVSTTINLRNDLPWPN